MSVRNNAPSPAAVGDHWSPEISIVAETFNVYEGVSLESLRHALRAATELAATSAAA